MNSLFTAVFESIWKRKETKIYLIFAVLPTLLYFIGSLFTGSNFNQIVAEANSISAFTFIGLLSTVLDSMVLPLMALVYLTITVFTRERDDHTLFLYKDLSRPKVFWAKLGSLITILVLFYSLFIALGLVCYFVRVVDFPYASGQVFSSTSADFWAEIGSLLANFLTNLIFLLLTVSLSLKMKTGLTVLVNIMLNLLVLVVTSKGYLLSYLFPKAYADKLFYSQANVPLLIGGMIVVTAVYCLIFTLRGLSYYKRMEF